MTQSILSAGQRRLLSFLSDSKEICERFYLTGGTALAEFYLKHRLSEDLDFFSEEEFDPSFVSVILKKLQPKIGVKKITYEQSFNRNLFFLELADETIKTEFTYFPFPRIEKKKKLGDLYIDSLMDIAVNKVFTIYQKPRARDFIDLYFILKTKEAWTIEDLIHKTQIKFDHHIDLIQLGGQLMKVSELKDYPKMLVNIEENKWQDFFITMAKDFSKKIVRE